MSSDTTPTNTLAMRRFGAGDILMIAGLVLSLVFLIVLMFSLGGETYSKPPFFVRLLSVITLTLTWVLAGIALGLSYRRQDWLLVLDGWALFTAATLCFDVGPITSLAGNGVDFFAMLSALLIVSGTFAARRRIGTFGSEQSASTPSYANTETELQNLKNLADKGLISAEEHAAKRKQALGRLV